MVKQLLPQKRRKKEKKEKKAMQLPSGIKCKAAPETEIA
jgi:hypothetical protein